MKKSTLAIVLMMVITTTAFAQSRNVTGSVYDKETKEAIMQTTVQLLKKDSTYVAGAVSDENGAFSLTAPADGSYILKLTNIGYTTLCKNITVSQGKDVALGKIDMKVDAVLLKEVVAKGVASKVTVKADTFVYNAAAFRTPEGSVIEELVKKLPGAQVDESGKITINGKEVKKIMVDGKEFMNGNSQTALKNLPTSIIDKVRAYDQKSDLARVTGIDDGEEETVLDFGIKPGMNRGTLANVDLGIGTKDRYSGRLMGGVMKEDLTVFGMLNANNTGDMGFPGGGGRGFGGGMGGGLNSSKMTAVNVNYQGDKLEADGSIFWNHRDGDALSKSSSENFVGLNSSFNNSINQNFSRSNSWNFQARVEWKPDTMTNIMFRPSYSYSSNDGLGNTVSGTYNADPYDYVNDPLEELSISHPSGIVVNTNESKNMSYSDTKNGSGMLQFNRRLDNKGRNVTLRADGGFSEGASNSISVADLQSLAAGLDDSYRSTITNRYSATPTKSHNYNLQATYSEPIGSRTFLQFRYQYRYSYNKSDKNTYDFSGLGSMYNDHPLGYRTWNQFLDDYVLTGGSSLQDYYDNDLSKFSEYSTYTHIGELTVRYITPKINLNVGFQVQPQRTKFKQDYQGVYTDTTRNVFNFAPTMRLRYKINDVSQLRINYHARSSEPSMTNLLNIVDNSNPTNISMGNPGLKPSFNHNVSVFYNGYRQSHMQSWMANVSFGTTYNNISNKVTYYEKETTVNLNGNNYIVPSGGRITKPENIDGNWNINGSIMFNTSIDSVGYWNVNTYSNVSYSNNVGYISLNPLADSQKNTTTNLMLSERLSFSYRNDWLEIEPNGYLTYTHGRNKLQPTSDLDTWQFSYGVNVNITTPWGTSLTTGLTESSRRGYNESSMNTDELLWNAQISQSFLSGRPLTVSLQFYDILHNQSNFSRTINAMQRSDTEYNTIHSYAMLHVIYRLNIFGGKGARRGGYGNPGMGGGPMGGGMGGPMGGGMGGARGGGMGGARGGGFGGPGRF